MVTYEEILDIIKTKNVELRHDVDVSLDAALVIAEKEFNMGIKSTFYIRFDGPYYNVLNKKTGFKIDKIINYDHQVGAHINAEYIEDELEMVLELKRFSDVCTFDNFTFHINSERTKRFNKEYYGGFKNMNLVDKYISDSRNSWNDEKTQWIKDNDNFTLNLHPEWWVYTGTSEDKLRMALKELEV